MVLLFILPAGAKKGIKGPVGFIKFQYEGLKTVCPHCGSDRVDIHVYRTDHPFNGSTDMWHRYVVILKCKNCRSKKVTSITDIIAGASNVQITYLLNQFIEHMW